MANRKTKMFKQKLTWADFHKHICAINEERRKKCLNDQVFNKKDYKEFCKNIKQ